MVREICEALESIAAQTPLLVILEDLHWADPSTLDLISAFARRRDPAKVLLARHIPPRRCRSFPRPAEGTEAGFACPPPVP